MRPSSARGSTRRCCTTPRTAHHAGRRHSARGCGLRVLDVRQRHYAYRAGERTLHCRGSGRFTTSCWARSRRRSTRLSPASRRSTTATARIRIRWTTRPTTTSTRMAKTCTAQPLGEYWLHGLGHMVGIDVHDPAEYPAVLKPGMVFTIEPGVYIPEEKLGVRIECDFLVGADGKLIDLDADLAAHRRRCGSGDARKVEGKDGPAATKLSPARSGDAGAAPLPSSCWPAWMSARAGARDCFPTTRARP